MEHELFVEQPVLDLHEGIKISADTALCYKTDKVEQALKNLTLETVLEDSGSNGFHSYKSRSCLWVTLQPGDILLFEKSRGYYLPSYPVCSIDDAVSDISALGELPRSIERGA